MFKLHKHKSDRLRDKLDFKFTNFQAIQVPKGWDRLFVSLVSIETGKTIAKTGKASVRNGTCRWPEAFSESIGISQENGDSEELEGNYFKFVVAMSSSRSGVLGEITVNLADYASSKTVNSLTLLLNKCNYSSSLQLKIQCVTPKAKYRDSQRKDTNGPVEYGNLDHDDMETKSDASDGALSRSTGSTSSNHLDSGSVSQASVIRDSSFESTGAVGFVHGHTESQDSIDSQNSGPSSTYHASNEHRQNHSSLGPNGHLKEPNSSVMSSPSSRSGSSKDLLEAAEVTIEELRSESRMWERNAKKLAVDVDALKKDLSVQSRKQETLNMELSASNQECSGLKQEIKLLKILLEESAQKQNAEEGLKLEAKDTDNAQHEMHEEIKFLRESNANLTEQLQKTQESNLELLTILQELEGIVELQKSEIQTLSSQRLISEESSKSDEGINDLKLQLEQLQETQEELEGYVQELEKTIEQKDSEIETERELRMDLESKWKMKIAVKEGEVLNLETELPEVLKEHLGRELEVEIGNETDLVQEIKILRSKMQELENDCTELTEENLQLLVKLNGAGKDLSFDDLIDSSCGSPDCTCQPKISKLRSQLLKLNQERTDNEAQIEDAQSSMQSKVQSLDLENKCSHLEIELQSFKEKSVTLEAELQKFHELVKEQQTEVQSLQKQLKHYQAEELGPNGRNKLQHNPEVLNSNAYANDNLREEEIRALKQQLSTLENQISSLRDESHLLEESLEKEKNVSSESSEEEKKKIVNLERLSFELQKGKDVVEQQLSELEKENMQLTERISALEAQLRYLADDKDASQQELRDSKSQVINLRDEIKRFESDIESQKVDMKQKLDDLQKRWLEAQEECEYLKQANPKLEATAENLIEECTYLQKYNAELKRQNTELVTLSAAVESQLRDSTAKCSECSQKVEALEVEFSAMVEECSLKEKSLKSELDSLINADREFKEKLMQENTSLNNMYSQKVVEAEKIQSELVHLIDQISVVQSEQVSSDTMLELSSLRTEKAKLEVSLQQLQRKFVLSESKLGDSEAKVQELTKELKDSRQKQEALMADHAKVLNLMESLKSNEAKHKTTIAGLEKNLKAYVYERLQLAEEVSSLKEQLQRATLLQGEILTLKTSLNNVKFESEKANSSLYLLRGEHETLKTEKDFLSQKVSNMEKGLSELEECQRSKITLQEKILRLEGDLAAREAMCVQDAELKFELNKVKRANGELHRRIKHLEQDQEEHLKIVKALQGKLKKKNQGTENGVDSVNGSEYDDESVPTISSSRDDNHLLERSGAVDTDNSSKIEALENELAEAMEANEMYKSQLKRFLSEEQKNSGNADESVHGVDVSALQEELRYLRDKHLQMSLKYAEVEAQREELTLKLKSTTPKRRWF